MADIHKRAAWFLTPSITGKTTDRRYLEFLRVTNSAGWKHTATYSEAEDSDRPPGLERMLKDATQGRFDVLMAWSIDQLGHSLQDLAVTFAQLQNAGVDLYLKEPMVDTSTPSGRVLFEVIGIFAQFERALARKRVVVGVARARKAGKPFGRPKIPPERAAAIRASLASGVSIRRTAKLHGVGITTVQRLKKTGDAQGATAESRSYDEAPDREKGSKPLPPG
jgi:DNA invertase Pin-like site-specific DNA recombinase